MQVIVAFLLLWMSLPVFSQGAEQDWPGAWVESFFLPLTFPQSEWRADDFGKPQSTADRELLAAFRPRIWVAPGSFMPIDFYQTYLPQTVVKNRQGQVIQRAPSRADLKRIERNYDRYLDFQGEHQRCDHRCGDAQPPLYGRVLRQHLRTPEGQSVPILVLKYTAVFSSSGLPAQMSWYKSLAVSVLGDQEQWHELDIHGAIHLLLTQAQQPFALLLAQHNNFRTYVVGKELHWPADNRLAICFAQRSNEPYLCPEGPSVATERAVGHPKNYGYVLTGQGGWLDGGRDKILGPQSGAVEVDYTLQFLPTRDPLYVAWIPLGDRLKLLGVFDNFFRTGPPGINMNTFPELKAYADLAQFWYLEPGDQAMAKRLHQALADFSQPQLSEVLQINRQRFWSQLQQYHHGLLPTNPVH